MVSSRFTTTAAARLTGTCVLGMCSRGLRWIVSNMGVDRDGDWVCVVWVMEETPRKKRLRLLISSTAGNMALYSPEAIPGRHCFRHSSLSAPVIRVCWSYSSRLDPEACMSKFQHLPAVGYVIGLHTSMHRLFGPVFVRSSPADS
jgi:hypothetical protein